MNLQIVVSGVPPQDAITRDNVTVMVDAVVADHGRPYGGRQGSEGAVQRRQLEPRPRGASPGGGRDPSVADAGEYF